MEAEVASAVYRVGDTSNEGKSESKSEFLVGGGGGGGVESSPEACVDTTVENESDLFADFGCFRRPMRSETAYVRVIFEALFYMLRRRGCSELVSSLLNLALSAEFVNMMRDDLRVAVPNDSGIRVCEMALREVSHYAVLLSNQAEEAKKMEALSGEEKKGEESFTSNFEVPMILENIHSLVTEVHNSLSFFSAVELLKPPELDLSRPTSADSDDPALTQFKDMLSWSVMQQVPDPGQFTTLNKYGKLLLYQL